MSSVTIVPYTDPAHRAQVIALWEAVFGYEANHNRPALVIEKKIAVKDQLFFVAVIGDVIVGTVMAGYDGHRGWIYSLSVSPSHRRQGIGTSLVSVAEDALRRKGSVKVNLQIMKGNEGVAAFYSALGYSVEQRVSMGKRIPENIPAV